MNISGPAAVAKPEMLFYAPGDLTVTFSLLVTPISLRIFSILLQKRRQYCLLRIQCKKGWHNAQIERSYSNAAI